MKLLDATLLRRFRHFGTQEEIKDPIIVAKYFTPDSNFNWYATEFDETTKTFFGLVDGFEKEFGSFSLSELESVKGKLGLPVERDLYFEECKISKIFPHFLQQ